MEKAPCRIAHRGIQQLRLRILLKPSELLLTLDVRVLRLMSGLQKIIKLY